MRIDEKFIELGIGITSNIWVVTIVGVDKLPTISYRLIFVVPCKCKVKIK